MDTKGFQRKAARSLPRLTLNLAVGAVFLIAATSRGAIGVYLLDENFNSMTTNAAPSNGWTNITTNGTVEVHEYPFAADKSVRIQKPNNSAGESSLSRTFTPLSGKVAFEAKVMVRDNNSNQSVFYAVPYIYDSTGAAVVSVAFQGAANVQKSGNIVAFDKASNQFQTVQTYATNDWYMIRVVINTATNTYDLFIDGVRKLNNVPVRNNPSGGTLAQFKYFLNGTNIGIMYVDNVKMWELAAFIASAPAPIFDVRDYGAIGDGSTNDTAAIQNAIKACNISGGSVYLGGGKNYVAGTLYLHSNMTFFIDSDTQLSSTGNGNDYPKQTPDDPNQTPSTNNNQLLNCRRAQLYAYNCTNLTIDGGGSIYGRGTDGTTPGQPGTWFGNSMKEAERPITIWSVLSDHVTIQNIYVRLSAMWTIVPMETDNLLIKNVLLNCDTGITHDGIDVVDCHHAVVQDCTVVTGDDSFVPKTGIRRGVDDLLIKNCFVAKAGSNGYKFGTASYGGFQNAVIQDCYAKNATYAAMVLMSRNGAEVSNINFSRIEFSNCGAAFFVLLGQQPGHPVGDVDKLGYLNNVHFTDILCSVDNSTSNKWGSNITGTLYNGVVYPITNLFFTNCNITFKGGDGSVPPNPPEWDSGTYPEVSMWGDLPAYGYWMRHVDNVTFTNCISRLSGSDARPENATTDVSNLNTPVDTDGDGLPDDWEKQYFGSTTAASPTADDDGDGMTNYAEFVAGTRPNDPTDRFAPTSVTSNNGTMTLVFRSVALKRYQLEYAADIDAPTWITLGNVVAASSTTLTVTDTPPAGTTMRFYHLRVLPD